MISINLVGLASNLPDENRALAYIEVNYNDVIYNWQIFIPPNTDDINAHIQSIQSLIINDIYSKELVWAALNPKTRTIDDPMTGESIEVPIAKEEIVKPSIPDYYALRRNEYPSLGDQLDAVWKGSDSQAFAEMQLKIAAVKTKYPKP